MSRATPGDFVAMMQGGAVDHQRAVDAVAQVTLIIFDCMVCVMLTFPPLQLCERIDSTLDIRHGIVLARLSSTPRHRMALSQSPMSRTDLFLI
jgi:hypothetical protein